MCAGSYGQGVLGGAGSKIGSFDYAMRTFDDVALACVQDHMDKGSWAEQAASLEQPLEPTPAPTRPMRPQQLSQIGLRMTTAALPLAACPPTR